MSEADDLELAQAWSERQAGAGDALISRYYGEMSRFFCNKVTSSDDAADLVHQTFLGVLEGLPRLRGETGFRPYLYGVAHNVLNAYIRKHYKRQRELDDYLTLNLHDLDPGSPSSIVMARRHSQVFVDALRMLPLRDQIVLELKYFSGLTSRESALCLVVPEPTLRGQLARGTERLRGIITALLAAPAPAQADAASVEDLEEWAAEVRAHQGWRTPRADST